MHEVLYYINAFIHKKKVQLIICIGFDGRICEIEVLDK